MNKDYLKEINSLYDNNRRIMEQLMGEKKLLENVFLDNRVPEKFKNELLYTYNALGEVIEKRKDINELYRETNKIEDVVGILYNKKQQRYMESILNFLKNVSANKNINIICFTIDDVNFESETVSGNIICEGSEEYGTTSIPTFIYNLGCHSKKSSVAKIKQLHMVHNATVVNPKNIFNQAIIFDIIASLSNSKSFLMDFEGLSPSAVVEYVEKYTSIFIIPERGILRNRIIKIENNPNDKMSCTIHIGNSHQLCSKQNLYRTIKETIKDKTYIIMKGEDTLNWNDAPLEARIYMQKGITGKWSVTGMIAKNEMFTSDSLYKDTADSLQKVLLNIVPNKIEAIEEKLTNYSTNICVYLDYYVSNLGSCTLDFVIDDHGMPYLLHFGGLEQKNYMLKLGGKDILNKYLSNLIDYLLYLKNKDN